MQAFIKQGGSWWVLVGAGGSMVHDLGSIKYKALGTNLNLIYLSEWLSLVQE